jgi:electron transfer flavoprotein beta subunit
MCLEVQTPRMEVLSVSEPPKRVGGGKVCLTHFEARFKSDHPCGSQVESVDELVAKLKEAGVLS